MIMFEYKCKYCGLSLLVKSMQPPRFCGYCNHDEFDARQRKVPDPYAGKDPTQNHLSEYDDYYGGDDDDY